MKRGVEEDVGNTVEWENVFGIEEISVSLMNQLELGEVQIYLEVFMVRGKEQFVLDYLRKRFPKLIPTPIQYCGDFTKLYTTFIRRQWCKSCEARITMQEKDKVVSSSWKAFLCDLCDHRMCLNSSPFSISRMDVPYREDGWQWIMKSEASFLLGIKSREVLEFVTKHGIRMRCPSSIDVRVLGSSDTIQLELECMYLVKDIFLWVNRSR